MSINSNKIIAAVAYVAMIFVNFLATSLPINGVTPGVVSDSYPNLFAPAGITFSIWGLIYLLLGAYILYQFGIFGKLNEKKNKLIDKVNGYFIITSLANIVWIFSWHYNFIGFSVIFMLILLVGLKKIAEILAKENLSGKEYYLQRLPFSIYFGWITIATIANITVYLVSLGWNGFGISDASWTIIILLIGSIIGILTILKNKDLAYGLVLIWAYIGIIIKHTSVEGHMSNYPAIIVTTIICILAIFGTIILQRFFLRESGKDISKK